MKAFITDNPYTRGCGIANTVQEIDPESSMSIEKFDFRGDKNFISRTVFYQAIPPELENESVETIKLYFAL